MSKNKYYNQYTEKELSTGYNSMLQELVDSPLWIKSLFKIVWDDFKQNKFKYDGATFVKERFENTLFEVASLIHDWFNSKGYVGKNVDKLFIIIMNQLGYNNYLIFIRSLLMLFTPLNIIRHKCLKTYKGDIKINNYIKSPN